MRRGFVALAVLALLVALAPVAGAIEIPPTQESRSTTQMTGTVRELVLDSDGGDISVKPSQTTTVSQEAHWVYFKPRVTMRMSNGVLTITSRCPNNAPLNNCRVDIVAAIAGTSKVTVSTVNGDVRVVRMAGPSVSGTTENGDVYLFDLTTQIVSGRSSNGDVKTRLRTAPNETQLRTSNGSIVAAVPRGAYAIVTRAGYGSDVRISGVTNSSTSPHKLTARTSTGDITITGR